MSEPRRTIKAAATLLLPALGLVSGFILGWRNRAARVIPARENFTPGAQRSHILSASRGGELAAGGYYAVWSRRSQDAAVAHHIEFQYAGMAHQAETAVTGMWLFLATELLFFGGLFFLYTVYRAFHQIGMADASRQTELWIGTVNTVLLVTSSAAFSIGLGFAQLGDNRRLFWASVITMALGTAFLALKLLEWSDDLSKHLFPGAGFPASGPDGGGEQLFWCFYWIGTVLHGVHMVVGVGLVGWIAWRARQERFSPAYYTPVEVVGLYWSFVDMVWLVLYPCIYLVGQIGS